MLSVSYGLCKQSKYNTTTSPVGVAIIRQNTISKQAGVDRVTARQDTAGGLLVQFSFLVLTVTFSRLSDVNEPTRDGGVNMRVRPASDICRNFLVSARSFVLTTEKGLEQRQNSLFCMAKRSVPRAFRRLSWSPTVGGFSIEFRIEPRRSAILQ